MSKPVHIDHDENLEGLREKLNILTEDIYKKFSSLDRQVFDFVAETPRPQQIVQSVQSDQSTAADVHASSHESGGSDTVNHDSLTGFVSNEHLPGIDEDNMVSDSAVHVPTQQSTKAYVDAKTVSIPLCIQMYDAVPARGTESNWSGGLLELDNAAAVNSGAPFNITTKGSGKILIVVNAGGDLVGDITLTGTSVDRNTKAQTGSDTSVITLTGATTDNSTTDANSNVVHNFVKAYISDKWFTGVVQITTADVAITDMDVFHVSFEQLNDKSNLTLNTFDANIFTTHANAEFDAYLYTLHVTGDECNVDNEAELHVGAVGGAAAQTALADKYFRLRQGNINEALDGSTDGLWVDVHYSNSPVYVEDVTIKVWLTQETTLT